MNTSVIAGAYYFLLLSLLDRFLHRVLFRRARSLRKIKYCWYWITFLLIRQSTRVAFSDSFYELAYAFFLGVFLTRAKPFSAPASIK